jgi:plastocyanin
MLEIIEGGRRRAILLALLLVPAAAGTIVYATAQAQEPDVKVTVKGKVQGGNMLFNPVWIEAATPANNRYTFRQPSTTVGSGAKKLSAYLPKELAVVALGAGAAAGSSPTQVHVSGGRTSPSTIVIPEGQNVQFINDDPFPHQLYDTEGVKDGLGKEATKPGGQRVWKPPAVGVYEIRDELFPSVRSWVVVEPKAFAVGKINFKGEFVVPGLKPGEYELQGYHAGKKVGDPLKIEVRPAPETQESREPLVVGKKADKKKDDEGDGKDAGKDEEKDK